MRAIIRLLHLRFSGQLTENQWCALLSLESHRDKYKIAEGSLWLDVETNCQDIKKWTGTDIEQEVLENMTCIVRTDLLTNLYLFQDSLLFKLCRELFPIYYSVNDFLNMRLRVIQDPLLTSTVLHQ
jgi:hypothetical protein